MFVVSTSKPRSAACRPGRADGREAARGATDERSLSPPGNVFERADAVHRRACRRTSARSRRSCRPWSGRGCRSRRRRCRWRRPTRRRAPRSRLAGRPAVGRDVERDLAGPGLGERHEPTVVRAAVAGVAAVADVDAAVAEREPGALLDVQRVLRSARIGVHRDLRDAGQRVEADELMVDVPERILDRRDHVDRVPCAVSITGVERMPSGSTLPHPTCAFTLRIGLPRWRFHSTVPSCASSAYTVSFSVAA